MKGTRTSGKGRTDEHIGAIYDSIPDDPDAEDVVDTPELSGDREGQLSSGEYRSLIGDRAVYMWEWIRTLSG